MPQIAHLAWARSVGRCAGRPLAVGATPRVDPQFAFRTPPIPAHRCTCTADDLAANRFTFLNRTVAFGPKVDWDDPGLPLLWRYHLHYFDYLWQASWPEAERLMLEWVRAHPRPASPAWDPYPLSVRAMNWAVLG